MISFDMLMKISLIIVGIIFVIFVFSEVYNITSYQHSLTPYKTEICIENGFDGFKADGYGWYVCHKEVCEYTGELRNCKIERKEFENLVKLAEERRDLMKGKN